MQKIGNVISRTLLTLAVAGIGLALTPRVASAEFLDFTVDETAANLGSDGPADTVVDKINGSYSERIDLGVVTFEVSLYVNFSQYLENEGADTVNTDLSTVGGDPDEYAMYALVTASGTYVGDGSNANPFEFTFTSASATVYLDPESDTTLTLPGAGDADQAPTTDGTTGTDDSAILSGSVIISALSDGTLTTAGGSPGSFQLVFSDPTLLSADSIDGAEYWPDLPLFNIRAFNNGDFDDVSQMGPTGGLITGDVSLTFQPVVPEPATMTLLGLGLLGSAMAARRRRKV